MTEVERSPFVLPPVPTNFVLTNSNDVVVVDPQPAPDKFLGGLIEHFSATSLRMLKMCPEQYRQRYVLGRKERPGAALTVGKATHAAVAFNMEQKVTSGQDLPPLQVVEYFHDLAWPGAVEMDGGEDEIRWDSEKGETPDTVRRDGERMTAAYQVSVAPRVQPVETPEQRISMHVEGVPIPFIGYLDTVEAGNVVDLKTGKQVQRKPDANWRFQGAIYSLAKQRPTHFHSVSRAKVPSIATPLTDEAMVIPYRDDLADLTRTVLLHYSQQVEWFMNKYGPDDPWPATGIYMDYRGGPMCNFCGYRQYCYAWEWERQPVVHP